jgi:hypothetical protein
MRPALHSTGYRVPRTKPTCLLHTWRPHRQRPFALVLHLHQHQSSRNLHLQLQYLAKNQSTQCCQSLITPGSDHPPVLEPHMVLNLPLDECIDNTHIVTWEKKKETDKKKLPTSDRKPKKGKEQDHLKKTSLGPLGKGNSSTHPRQNCAQAKSTNHQTKTRKQQRAPPAHMQAPPEPMQLPWTNTCKPLEENRAVALAQLWPVANTSLTSVQHVNRASTLTGQTGDHDRSNRWHTEPRIGSIPPENLPNAFSSPKHAQTSPLVNNAWIKLKIGKMQPRASQIDKFNIGCYTCPNEQVRYSIAS